MTHFVRKLKICNSITKSSWALDDNSDIFSGTMPANDRRAGAAGVHAPVCPYRISGVFPRILSPLPPAVTLSGRSLLCLSRWPRFTGGPDAEQAKVSDRPPACILLQAAMKLIYALLPAECACLSDCVKR